MMMSFLRPVMNRKPSSSTRPRSPVCSQPSIDRAERRVVVLVVALEDVRALEQHLAVVGDPDLQAGQRAADRAEAVGVDGRDRRRGRRLRHPVALEHRHAAGEEELEDLLRDRRGARGRLAQPAAERGADVLEQLLLGARRSAPGARPGPPGRRPGAARTFSPTWVARLDLRDVAVRGDERVELLEDPRHRRQVGRLDLGELGDDLLRVAAEVGERGAEVEARRAGSAARTSARAGGRGRRRRRPGRPRRARTSRRRRGSCRG